MALNRTEQREEIEHRINSAYSAMMAAKPKAIRTDIDEFLEKIDQIQENAAQYRNEAADGFGTDDFGDGTVEYSAHSGEVNVLWFTVLVFDEDDNNDRGKGFVGMLSNLMRGDFDTVRKERMNRLIRIAVQVQFSFKCTCGDTHYGSDLLMGCEVRSESKAYSLGRAVQAILNG